MFALSQFSVCFPSLAETASTSYAAAPPVKRDVSRNVDAVLRSFRRSVWRDTERISKDGHKRPPLRREPAVGTLLCRFAIDSSAMFCVKIRFFITLVPQHYLRTIMMLLRIPFRIASPSWNTLSTLFLSHFPYHHHATASVSIPDNYYFLILSNNCFPSIHYFL